MSPPKAMEGERDNMALFTFSPIVICEHLVPQAWPSAMESGGSSCVASPCPRSETLAWGGRGWRSGSKRRADTWWTALLALKVRFQLIFMIGGQRWKPTFRKAQKQHGYFWEPFPYFSRGSSARPFDPTFFLSCTVSNVICCLVFGERFSYDNEHFLSLLKIISQTLRHFSSPIGQVIHDVH